MSVKGIEREIRSKQRDISRQKWHIEQNLKHGHHSAQEEARLSTLEAELSSLNAKLITEKMDEQARVASGGSSGGGGGGAGILLLVFIWGPAVVNFFFHNLKSDYSSINEPKRAHVVAIKLAFIPGVFFIILFVISELVLAENFVKVNILWIALVMMWIIGIIIEVGERNILYSVRQFVWDTISATIVGVFTGFIFMKKLANYTLDNNPSLWTSSIYYGNKLHYTYDKEISQQIMIKYFVVLFVTVMLVLIAFYVIMWIYKPRQLEKRKKNHKYTIFDKMVK